MKVNLFSRLSNHESEILYRVEVLISDIPDDSIIGGYSFLSYPKLFNVSKMYDVQEEVRNPFE